MDDWLTMQNLIELSNQYRALGPIIGFLLPFIEAFLPFLPIFAFVIANADAYGFWFGFLLSWSGTVTGSYLLFLLVRNYGQSRFVRYMTKHKRIQKLINWVDRNGFGPLFLLLCFPFTPSSLVNIVAGLSKMKKKHYLWTLIAGKFIMIITITYIGYDLRSLLTNPGKTAAIVIVILLLWIAGKQLEKRLDKKVEKDSDDK
ncbi:TVP38/TMEM64 family protein [Chungangia koreensis]|uniref:TVP38/TMEM64 family membrane protein n=1 Tax=Chungangia koreensis TaxID=752657 RepID=A0ABV8X0U2_9LACT